MALYEASIDKDWKDFTDIHATIRKNLEKPIEKFISGEKQNLFALWGPYGQGKTQLMYHLFKYSWEKGGIALFTKLEKLLPEDEMGSDKFKNYIEALVKQTIIKIKSGKIDDADLLNNECKSWLKQWLKNNPIREKLEEKAILLIDEMEQNYSSLLDKVTTDDNSPLKDCTAQNSFMIIAAFAPTSQYEAMTGEAEKRRWEPYRLPTLPVEVLREKNAKYGNFTWWVSKGRLGLAFKILDILRNRSLNDFKDFEEFADKDVGSIAKVPSIDTRELANYMKIKDYIIELFPHPEIKHKEGIVSGKIIKEEAFINILKDGLTEERWEAKEIELFGDYLKYVISALSSENGFSLPQQNDGNDPKRILTILKTAVDFAIETEGRKEVIASIYDRIYKWRNFEQFYYTNIFPRVSGLGSIDGSVVSYDLLPKLFPLPITSPVIGDIPIKQCRENLLTSHPPTGYLAKDIETLHGGQIVFFYFINNQKLKQFLNSTEVKDFLPPDRGLVCIVLENKEEIRLDGVAGWLKAQNRIKVEYPTISLMNFLISFMNYYQQSFQDKELRSTLQGKVEEEFKKDRTLHRRLNHHKNILDEFIKFKEKSLVLSREKFEVKNKDTINTYRTRYDKFSDVVGVSFCKINELSTFYAFKQIIMGSDELRELRTGVPGLLKDVSVGKIGKKPLKLSTTLETIKDSYGSELSDLMALANLVDEGDFIKLSSDENTKEVLRGIFKYIKLPKYDKSLFTQEINGGIKSIEKLKKSREEEINKTFGGFEVKESKSERTKAKWSGILEILGELNGGYLEYLICNFAKTILDKFKDDILSNDQNWLTEWQRNKQYVENYNEKLVKIDNLKLAPKWLNTDKNEMKENPQERYFNAIKSLTNFQDEVDFNAVNNLNWDSFNEEVAQVNNELDQVMKVEEKLKEIVVIANEVNKILGGEEI